MKRLMAVSLALVGALSWFAPAALAQSALLTNLRQHVKYVFVLYQENRSFDSYFGTFPGADGLFSQPAKQTPGFYQKIINQDGQFSVIHPFRIGPAEYAADTDDVDHSHALLAEKMDVQEGKARMDHFALAEEHKYMKGKTPSLMAKQFGELTMAYMDGDTVPFLWLYADRFVLFDHIFQSMVGPSTPGNLAIIAAQSGQTQEALHPGEGEPVLNDNDPYWGSPQDKQSGQPANPHDFPGYHIQRNQTYATLPLSLAGAKAPVLTQTDREASDLDDIHEDIAYLGAQGHANIPWAWFEEGYDREPSFHSGADPTDAQGVHASYITHHNGPQYFGYLANNPSFSHSFQGLGDFFSAVQGGKLPDRGVFYVKGGYRNIFGLKPADPSPAVQKNFLGDDDHPGYSDAQISEALLAHEINAIARSPYWKNCVIIITWDDSEGDYDHVPPPIRAWGRDGKPITDGPRVPFLLISPYAKSHFIDHASGDHGSVVKLVDTLFQLTPLAKLPDEQKGEQEGKKLFHQNSWGPDDADPSVTDLLSAFDPERLAGTKTPVPASQAEIPDALLKVLPQVSGYGLKQLGIVPTDRLLKVVNRIPADFSPRPKTGS